MANWLQVDDLDQQLDSPLAVGSDAWLPAITAWRRLWGARSICAGEKREEVDHRSERVSRSREHEAGVFYIDRRGRLEKSRTLPHLAGPAPVDRLETLDYRRDGSGRRFPRKR